LIELVSSLKEASRNFIFSFLPKIAAKKYETISDHIDGKGTISYTLQLYSSRDTIPSIVFTEGKKRSSQNFSLKSTGGEQMPRLA
jgi:hypothetical protein